MLFYWCNFKSFKKNWKTQVVKSSYSARPFISYTFQIRQLPRQSTLCVTGLLRLQEVLKATRSADHKITVRKLDPYEGTYISMFKDLKQKSEYHIIVDCNVKKIQTLLHEVSISEVSRYTVIRNTSLYILFFLYYTRHTLSYVCPTMVDNFIVLIYNYFCIQGFLYLFLIG